MALETASYIHQLNPQNPSGADRLKDGDDHIRMIKAALKATFPGLTGPLDPSVTQDLLNGLKSAMIPMGFVGIWTGASSTVPAGWAIMDGRTVSRSDGQGTITLPDWRGVAVVGASDDRPLGTKFGQYSRTYTTSAVGDHSHGVTVSTAGAHSHTGSTGATSLSTEQIPAHTHFTVAAGRGDGSTTVSPTNYITAEKTSDGDSGYRLLGTSTVATLGPTTSVGAGAGHAHSIPTDGAHTHDISLTAAGNHSHTVSIDTAQPSVTAYFIMKV